MQSFKTNQNNLTANYNRTWKKKHYIDTHGQDLGTVMILSFRTDMPGQTVQTHIRLLLQAQSDQGLHCLPFRLHRLDLLLYCRAT